MFVIFYYITFINMTSKEPGLCYPSLDSAVIPKREEGNGEHTTSEHLPHIGGPGDIVGRRIMESVLQTRRALTPKPE